MTETNNILCVIPCRGGSKGIPGKNIIDLGGKPMLAWTIKSAQEALGVNRIIVSTDCDEIADLSRELGAEVPFRRPEHIASDDVHAVNVVLHALEWLDQNENYHPQGVMMLLPTSPLRLAADIDAAINLFLSNNSSAVVSVVDLGKYMTNLRFVEENKLIRTFPDENPNAQRQGLRKLYSVNGSIFLADPDVLRNAKTFHVDGALPLIMDIFSSIDVNSWDDLSLARRVISNLEPWKSMPIGYR